ncbi:MAG: hypothetical protein ACK2UK_01940, partial [Candidatus Promineifilaceae bacterium]
TADTSMRIWQLYPNVESMMAEAEWLLPGLLSADDCLEPVGEAVCTRDRHAARTESTLHNALELFREGDIEQGMQRLREVLAEEGAEELITADQYYTPCWYGSLYGHTADVLFACEKAVELDGTDAAYRDGRGLARALNGDLAGAADDFRFSLQESDFGSFDSRAHYIR